ncbi:DUF6357 family protein [Streptomyces griseoflavus]|uniref:DUF6357 family protein n=1 Tax=Streptomyces griseoflavus TaxID=35619 RepID=UPI0033C32A12
MARPYDPGPKQFVFAADDGSDHEVSVADPQEAYVAFSAFFRGRNSGTYTVGDESAGQSLVLMPGQGVIARVKGAPRPRSEYLLVDRANRYLPSAMLFFENGYAGLDRFGQWFSDLADLAASPETRGAARAATFTTERARSKRSLGSGRLRASWTRAAVTTFSSTPTMSTTTRPNEPNCSS